MPDNDNMTPLDTQELVEFWGQRPQATEEQTPVEPHRTEEEVRLAREYREGLTEAQRLMSLLNSTTPLATPPPPAFNDREIEREITRIERELMRPGGLLCERRFLVQKLSDAKYMKTDHNGRMRYVITLESAGIFTGTALYNMITFSDMTIRVLMLKDPPVVPGCLMTDWFSAPFITLISDAPNNVVVRATMMKMLKVGPPNELDTFEKLKDWVETSFPKPNQLRAQQNQVNDRGADPVPRPVDQTPSVNVDYFADITERGRCSYTRVENQNLTFRLTVNMVREAIQDGISSMEELRDWVKETVDDDRSCCEISSDYFDEETSDHESNDTETNEFGLVDDRFPEAAIRRMIERDAPELLDSLQ